MKKLFLSLMTANFSGMLISVVVFLINTYRLELGEYFLYSYVNSALLIAGSFVAFGTDNLALVSYDTYGAAEIYRSVKRIKFGMLLFGAAILTGSCIYFAYTNPNYLPSLVAASCVASIPFLLSFYCADTHYYIHKELYGKYIKSVIYARLICLIPIVIAAAFFKNYLLLTTLVANSASAMLPPLIFNRKINAPKADKLASPEKIFHTGRLFENFILNSFPVLYINAVFFLFNSVSKIFVKSGIVVYTSRIYIVLMGVLSAIIATLISSHLKKASSFIEKTGKFLWIVLMLLLTIPVVLRFAIDIQYEIKFVLWSILEFGSMLCFLILFFIKIYKEGRNKFFVPQLFILSMIFFFYTRFTTSTLEDLMFKRTVFSGILVLLVYPVSLVKQRAVQTIQ